jgi:hypothetical protein
MTWQSRSNRSIAENSIDPQFTLVTAVRGKHVRSSAKFGQGNCLDLWVSCSVRPHADPGLARGASQASITPSNPNNSINVGRIFFDITLFLQTCIRVAGIVAVLSSASVIRNAQVPWDARDVRSTQSSAVVECSHDRVQANHVPAFKNALASILRNGCQRTARRLIPTFLGRLPTQSNVDK